MTRPLIGWSVAGLVVGLTGLAILAMTPGIGFDAAPGLIAAEQRLAGRGNSLTELVVADPSDLRRDITQPIAWWPPGQQIAVHGLRSMGVSLTGALELLVVITWVTGLVAWAAYHWLVLDARWLAPWTIATVALLRLSHTSGFQFTGGETLLWGLFPVVVLVHLYSVRPPAKMLFATVAGFLATTMFVLKYSGGILAVGLGLGWVWRLDRTQGGRARTLAWLSGAAIGVGVVALTGVVGLLGGANPLTSVRSHDPFAVIAWGLFGPFEAMSDLTEAATSVSKRLGGGPLPERVTGVFAVATGALFLSWVATATKSGVSLWPRGSDARGDAFRIALSVIAMSGVALVVLRLNGGDISWEARHHQYGVYLLLPFVADWLLQTFRARGRTLRFLSAACLVVFLLTPAVYGGLVLARRAWMGPTGIDREWSREGPGASPPLRDFSRVPGFDQALVATISPRTALTFAGQRVLLVMTLRQGETAASPEASWRSQRFHERPAGGVALVLPPGVPAEDTETLLAAFVDIRTWRSIPLAHAPAAQLWMGY